MEVLMLASLFLLIPGVCSAGNNLVELEATDLVAEPCHSRVMLHCNISWEEGLEINSLSWIRSDDKKTLCAVSKSEVTKSDSNRILCDYTRHAQLRLTFSDLWPTDEGEYICKLRSNLGMKSTTSKVKAKECYRKADRFSSTSEVACHFHGVYPQGEVHWFHHGKKVTFNSVAPSSQPDHKGMYNVSSTLLIKGDSNVYNCSLWIPDTGTYLTSMLVHPARRGSVIGDSSGGVSEHIVGLGCILLQARLFIE